MEYRCRDGCGAAAITDGLVIPPGWEHGEITGRVRCPNCRAALQKINEKETPECNPQAPQTPE